MGVKVQRLGRVDKQAMAEELADLGGVPMPPVKKSRAERRQEREADDYGAHAAWIRTLRSVWSDARDTCAAHVRHTRGASGDFRDLVPMSHAEERRWHDAGAFTFAKERGTTAAVVDGWATLLWNVSPANPDRLPVYLHLPGMPKHEPVTELKDFEDFLRVWDCVERREFGIAEMVPGLRLRLPITDPLANAPVLPTHLVYHEGHVVAYATSLHTAHLGLEELAGLREGVTKWATEWKPRQKTETVK